MKESFNMRQKEMKYVNIFYINGN